MRNGPYELIIAPKLYPGKKYRGRYAYEHHVVWWREHRSLPKTGWEIHHKNGDHRDNRIDNLQLVTAHEHRLIHGALQKRWIDFKCGFCGKPCSLPGNLYRTRLRRRKYGKLFCSSSCGAKNQFRSGRKV